MGRREYIGAGLCWMESLELIVREERRLKRLEDGSGLTLRPGLWRVLGKIFFNLILKTPRLPFQEQAALCHHTHQQSSRTPLLLPSVTKPIDFSSQAPTR